MPRTEIPIQELPANGGVDTDLVLTAADAANDMYFQNTGRELIYMKGAAAAQRTAVIASVPDENGRSGDVTMNPAATKLAIAGPFNPSLFNQRGAGDLGKVFVNLAPGEDADVSFAVVRINK
jgi:hypothetical protein